MRILFAAALLAASAPAVAELRPIDRRLNIATSAHVFDPAAAQRALAEGADVNARNSSNETLLIFAVRMMAPASSIEWLLKNGADPRARDANGKDALDHARQMRLPADPAYAGVLRLMGAGPGAPAEVERRAGASRPGVAPAAVDRAAWAVPPARGVYECVNQRAMIDPMAFSILDGRTFMTSGGRRDRYAYDVRTGVLSLGGGAAPARFQRIGERVFRALKADGSLAGFTCPRNDRKNPERPPW